MAAEDFDAIEADAGSGGANFAMDTFTDLSGDTRVMPFSCIVVPDGTGYARVGPSNSLPVSLASVPSHAVTNAGTFAVQASQSGTWTVDLGATDNAVLDAIAASVAGTLTVGLPTGAATAAKQPALGTAGTASADVLSVQGIASGTNLNVSIAAFGAGVSNAGELTCHLGSEIFEDDVASSGQSLLAIAGVRRDTAASSSGADGDWGTFNFDSTGRLWCNVSNTLTVASHAVTNAGTFAVQAAQSGTWTVDLGATDNAVLDAIAASLAGTLTVGSHAVTNAGTFAVQAAQSGTWNITNVSGTVSLPTGASIAAKQPALGTAGTASADVITVQGIASMTALKVDGSAVTQPVSGTVAFSNTTIAATNAGTFAVQVDGSALTSLQLLDDVVFTDDAAFTPGTSKVAAIGFQADESSTDSVDEGDVGAARMTLDRKQIVTDLPHTSGGLTMSKTVSAASTNATVAKASAGQLYEIMVSNVNAAARYLKLYDKATSPTVGTDTPVWTLIVPGNTAGAGIAKSIPKGLAFASGIAFALTTEATDAGTTGVAANELVVNLGYK